MKWPYRDHHGTATKLALAAFAGSCSDQHHHLHRTETFEAFDLQPGALDILYRATIDIRSHDPDYQRIHPVHHSPDDRSVNPHML